MLQEKTNPKHLKSPKSTLGKFSGFQNKKVKMPSQASSKILYKAGTKESDLSDMLPWQQMRLRFLGENEMPHAARLMAKIGQPPFTLACKETHVKNPVKN